MSLKMTAMVFVMSCAGAAMAAPAAAQTGPADPPHPLTQLAPETALPTAEVPEAYLGGAWVLMRLDGQVFSHRATIDFSKAGQVSGAAPCNRYSGGYDGTLPTFLPQQMAATMMACPNLDQEAAFFDALAAMTRAEVRQDDAGGALLVLSGPGDRRMEFAHAPT